MAELKGVHLGSHLRAIVSELKSRNSIYGYPARKFFRGFPGYDFSVNFHEKVAATLIGPASGPHTQLAQNILLSFLGGGRIMELKTVQIRDQLDIPRPCIDARNIGFNIEWSQELRLADSYREYVIAWVLLKLIEEMELLEIPKGDPFYQTVFDISVGYDLKGISSPQIHQWLRDMKDAGPYISELLESLPQEFNHLKNVPIDPYISDSVTLSTFHGCPREEIEAIVQHLISEHRFHVIVKMNPTLLGYESARKILHEDLGYGHLQLDPAAFENDLQYSEGVAMMKRLEEFARKHGCCVGAKFTNTLVVQNNQDVFDDEVMYLSGPPLHVLSMQAMHKFRQAMGAHFHISFSAGIDKQNFADAVSCNMKPITVCTDLLKTGGYTRMFGYLKNLKQALEKAEANTLASFIKNKASATEHQSVASAGMQNAQRIVPELAQDQRYHFQKNSKEPPKIDSHLRLFDCISCNKCLPVCPNAANFTIPSVPQEKQIANYKLEGNKLVASGQTAFVIEKAHQIATLADWCNECGDCDTYCPEYGGPYIEKPRFFFSEQTYRQFRDYDGYYFPEPYALKGRLDGKEYELRYDDAQHHYIWQYDGLQIILDENDELKGWQLSQSVNINKSIDMEPYHIFKTVLRGFLESTENYPTILLDADANE